MHLHEIRPGMKIPPEFTVLGSSRIVFAEYTDHGDHGTFDVRVEGPRDVTDEEATKVAQEFFQEGTSSTMLNNLGEWLQTYRPGDPTDSKSALRRILDEEWF